MKRIWLSLLAAVLALALSSCSILQTASKDAESNQKLYGAIGQGNLEEAKEALEKGADSNQFTGVNGIRTDTGIWEKNPLRAALFKSQGKIAELLIDHGADVNYVDCSGVSLLMYTAYSAKEDFTELLLAHHADVAARGTNGDTALDYALTNTSDSEADLLPVVRLLVDNGAPIVPRTVLHALKPDDDEYYDRYGIVKLLIQKEGAVDFGGELPQELADAVNNNADAVTDYISVHVSDKDADDADFKQVLFYAAAWDDVDAIKAFVEGGGDRDLSDAFGNTLLSVAARYGSLSTLQWLCGHGADLDAKNADSGTALVAATLYGQHDAAAFLIGRKAELSAAAPYGIKYTVKNDVMINAAGHGDVELMERLLDAGYALDEWHAFEALFNAVQNDRQDAADFLLGKGVPIDLENDQETVLSLACVKGKAAMVDFLIENGADVNGATVRGLPLHCAAEVGETAVVDSLIRNGADVNAVLTGEDGVDDTSPLMKAISCGSYDCVKLLVENGADLEYTSSKGSRETALLLSVPCGSTNITSYLLQQGADPKAKDANGFTAYDRAKNMNDRGMKSLLKSKS